MATLWALGILARYSAGAGRAAIAEPSYSDRFADLHPAVAAPDQGAVRRFGRWDRRSASPATT